MRTLVLSLSSMSTQHPSAGQSICFPKGTLTALGPYKSPLLGLPEVARFSPCDFLHGNSAGILVHCGQSILFWGFVECVEGLPLWFSWWRICLQYRRPGFNPWVGKIPWRRERLPTPVFWPGEFQGLHSLWGHKESDTTERFSLLKCVRVQEATIGPLPFL